MKIETRPTFLQARYVPGPPKYPCRPFDGRAFPLRLCLPCDGLRARWAGRGWVHDPDGREVLMRVVLMETQSGEWYVSSIRSEANAVPIIVRLGVLASSRPAFTTGPADLLGTGDAVLLRVEPVE